RGRARPGVEQRQLAEHLARAEHAQHVLPAVLGGAGELDLAFEHDVEPVAGLVLVEDRLAFGKLDLGDARPKRRGALPVERGEQGGLAQHVFGVHTASSAAIVTHATPRVGRTASRARDGPPKASRAILLPKCTNKTVNMLTHPPPITVQPARYTHKRGLTPWRAAEPARRRERTRHARETAAWPYPCGMATNVAAARGRKPETRLGLVRRARKMNRILAETYPDAHCELDFTNSFELLVATVLSAQTTDVRVNLTTPALFAKYPTPDDLAAADPEDVEAVIKPTGFFRAKTRSIIGLAQGLRDRFGGEVPRKLDDLVTLPGVGRKTANVVLGNAFGVPGLTVDTHFQRLVRRFGWTEETDPVKIEKVVGELIPKREWTVFSHRIIWHGRRICHARKPACGACPLAALCPSYGTGPTEAEEARKLVRSGPFS